MAELSPCERWSHAATIQTYGLIIGLSGNRSWSSVTTGGAGGGLQFKNAVASAVNQIQVPKGTCERHAGIFSWKCQRASAVRPAMTTKGIRTLGSCRRGADRKGTPTFCQEPGPEEKRNGDNYRQSAARVSCVRGGSHFRTAMAVRDNPATHHVLLLLRADTSSWPAGRPARGKTSRPAEPTANWLFSSPQFHLVLHSQR